MGMTMRRTRERRIRKDMMSALFQSATKKTYAYMCQSHLSISCIIFPKLFHSWCLCKDYSLQRVSCLQYETYSVLNGPSLHCNVSPLIQLICLHCIYKYTTIAVVSM